MSEEPEGMKQSADRKVRIVRGCAGLICGASGLSDLSSKVNLCRKPK